MHLYCSLSAIAAIVLLMSCGIAAFRTSNRRITALPMPTSSHMVRKGVQGTLFREMGISQAAHIPPIHVATNAILQPPNIAKHVKQAILRSPVAASIASMTPPVVKNFLSSVYPGELLLLLLFRTSYSRLLKLAHQVQGKVWKAGNLGTPNEWRSSILGFLHERCHLLARLITFNYCAKIVCQVLLRVGFSLRADLPDLLSRISYALFFTHFADLFKTQFLRTFFPHVSESKRQSYIINKSASVAIWTVGGLVACEMVSSYLKVPLSSTLAFGGVGGLAVGLSLRDIAANFMGGMMLLFNEPFTPGDMITFMSGKTEVVGRVERVGWGQTRIRGRDTRPTYVPNSHFAQAAVTNMERITHRKFETTVSIRFEDYGVMAEVIERVKERLRGIPKLDTLSMPFRVSFTRVAAYCLEIEITCYFATKSIDEFLSLQQMANIEVIGAIHDCGAALALPTSLMQLQSGGSALPAVPLVGDGPFQAVPRGEGGGGGGGAGSASGAAAAATTSAVRESDLAVEMQVAEALMGIPLPSQEGTLPLGTNLGKGALDEVLLPARTVASNLSSSGVNSSSSATSSTSASYTTTRPTPATGAGYPPLYNQQPGMHPPPPSAVTPTSSSRSSNTDSSRPGSSNRDMLISASHPRHGAPSDSSPNTSTTTSTDTALGRGDTDSGRAAAPLSGLWQESARSAGIIPDGRKYIEGRAEES